MIPNHVKAQAAELLACRAFRAVSAFASPTDRKVLSEAEYILAEVRHAAYLAHEYPDMKEAILDRLWDIIKPESE